MRLAKLSQMRKVEQHAPMIRNLEKMKIKPNKKALLLMETWEKNQALSKLVGLL